MPFMVVLSCEPVEQASKGFEDICNPTINPDKPLVPWVRRFQVIWLNDKRGPFA